MDLTRLLVIYASFLAFNLIFNAILWFRYRADYYRILCLAWGCCGLSFLLQGLTAEAPYKYRMLTFSTSMFANLFFAKLVTLLTRTGFRAKPFVLAHLASVTLSFVLASLGVNVNLMAIPAAFTNGLPGPYYCIKALIYRRRELSVVTFCFILATLLGTAHGWDYPYAIDKPELVLLAFSVAIVLALAASVFSSASVLEAVTVENTRIRVEMEHRAMLTHASKLASLGEMAGGVAHEINSPLATIHVNAEQALELLAEDPVDVETVAGFLKSIGSMSGRIARITSGLRSFARETGDEPLSLIQVDVLLSDTLLFFEEMLKNRGVSLSLPRALAASIRCRPTQISQVLLSLINNAMDAVMKNAGEKRIGLEVGEEAGSVRLVVWDNGPGIPGELRDRIFEPFFTTKGVGQGAGLGLSVSKGIAEAHGGSLVLEPSETGARFVITLPKAQA